MLELVVIMLAIAFGASFLSVIRKRVRLKGAFTPGLGDCGSRASMVWGSVGSRGRN
jgi:hypothetical protein